VAGIALAYGVSALVDALRSIALWPRMPNRPTSVSLFSTADQVIAFSGGPPAGTVALNTTTSLLEQTLTLPTNIESAFLDVFAQGQSTDEFCISCVPAAPLRRTGKLRQHCVAGEVTIDGNPAGVGPSLPPELHGRASTPNSGFIPGVQTFELQALPRQSDPLRLAVG